eukprot:m.170503 g.170503  ORF g.170503 m.170503 type:complete len:518 (+) comp17251_c0_seq3:905-2458(+)
MQEQFQAVPPVQRMQELQQLQKQYQHVQRQLQLELQQQQLQQQQSPARSSLSQQQQQLQPQQQQWKLCRQATPYMLHCAYVVLEDTVAACWTDSYGEVLRLHLLACEGGSQAAAAGGAVGGGGGERGGVHDGAAAASGGPLAAAFQALWDLTAAVQREKQDGSPAHFVFCRLGAMDGSERRAWAEVCASNLAASQAQSSNASGPALLSVAVCTLSFESTLQLFTPPPPPSTSQNAGLSAGAATTTVASAASAAGVVPSAAGGNSGSAGADAAGNSNNNNANNTNSNTSSGLQTNTSASPLVPLTQVVVASVPAWPLRSSNSPAQASCVLASERPARQPTSAFPLHGGQAEARLDNFSVHLVLYEASRRTAVATTASSAASASPSGMSLARQLSAAARTLAWGSADGLADSPSVSPAAAVGLVPSLSIAASALTASPSAASGSADPADGNSSNSSSNNNAQALCARSVVRRICNELHDLSWMNANMTVCRGRRSSLPLHVVVLARFVRRLEDLSLVVP